MKIYIEDVRKSGHCVKGTKQWFDNHDLDFKDFLKNGIEEQLFLEKGDDIARKVVKDKRERENTIL